MIPLHDIVIKISTSTNNYSYTSIQRIGTVSSCYVDILTFCVFRVYC